MRQPWDLKEAILPELLTEMDLRLWTNPQGLVN